MAFILPSIVIVVCYSAIFYKIRTTRKKLESHIVRTPVSTSFIQSEERSKRQRMEDIRLTKMMLTIFILFLVCFLPLMLVNVLDDKMTQPSVHIIASVLAWMSAAINPFIYSIQNHQYQQAFRNVVGKRSSREKAGKKRKFVSPSCMETPVVTPASSKASVNTINIELKSLHFINSQDS